MASVSFDIAHAPFGSQRLFMVEPIFMGIDWAFEVELIGRTCGSLLLGALIGWERERSGHPAGIRTYAFVTMGACVFGLIGSHAPGIGDSTRISAQVIAGIGFLGAGLIIHDRGRVRGLTTAASLWAASAIGLAVAHHFAILATCVMVLLVVLLRVQDTSAWVYIAPRARRRRLRQERKLEKQEPQ
jgi:putative Mg2+ transporter-C (MgtC) family protein